MTAFTLGIYLSREEILADKTYHCFIDDCGATFHNAANMQMHVTRHHKADAPQLRPVYQDSDVSKKKHFFCPSSECTYHQTPSEVANGARHFTNFRSLKQHYLKVHGERTFGCSTCGKLFATSSFLRHHRLSCGRTFQCEHCSFAYGSREALLTHAKRKQHGYVELLSSRKQTGHHLPGGPMERRSISTGTQTAVIRREDRTTQTLLSTNDRNSCNGSLTINQYGANIDTSLHDCSGYAALMDAQSQQQALYDAGSVVVCTETQTDFMDVMFPAPENRHDPLLSYTHMYTQTSDDQGLIADLGLSTIETQTSWNDGGETFGDYLVSTETQTNFDVHGFTCSSNDKMDQAVQCQQTQIPYLQRTFGAAGGTAFLSVMNNSIDHRSNDTQTS